VPGDQASEPCRKTGDPMVKIIAWNIARREEAWRALMDTDADIALLRARCDALVSGPWGQHGHFEQPQATPAATEGPEQPATRRKDGVAVHPGRRVCPPRA
jgi:hypothetical protein